MLGKSIPVILYRCSVLALINFCSLGQAQREHSSNRYHCEYLEGEDNSIAIFEFKYRSKGKVQKADIAGEKLGDFGTHHWLMDRVG